MGDSYWWSSILRNIRLASDLIRVKHDVKLLPRFDLSLMRTDQNDTKLVMVLTTSAIPVKGNVIYAHIFTLHMIRISISFQLSK